MDDEDIWGDDEDVLRNNEWEKISSDFTNAGYREGITAGKESALQQGFDDGFAQVGVPLGRELGILRGCCSALLAFLQHRSDTTISRIPRIAPTPPSETSMSIRTPIPIPTPIPDAGADADALGEVREIAHALANVRLSDIAPPDLEAIAHAREHLGLGDAMDRDDAAAALNEEIRDRRDMEGLEDLMVRMGGGGGGGSAPGDSVRVRPTAEDVGRLKERLLAVARGLGLSLTLLLS